MNCPSCGAPLKLTDGLINLRCDYCKAVIYTGPDASGIQTLGQNEDLLCPVCSIPLWDAKLAGVPIRTCKQCHGMLVPMQAFEPLVEQVRAEQHGTEIPVTDDQSELNRKLACPSCHHPMETHFYYGGGHVVMEDCERCELNWLDGGALMRIVNQTPAGETYSF